ncbi:unnamed protein product, partial [Ascophyllum nodosum]
TQRLLRENQDRVARCERQMETLQQHRLAGYVVSLHERFSSEILEEDHLDQSIDQELEGAPWLSPFLPSSPQAVSSFTATFVTGLVLDDVVLDIGCGDGRVLVAVAKVLGCRGIGVDVSQQACVKSAREMSGAEGVSDLLTFHCADATRPEAFEELGLAAATVVFLYVYPTLLARLETLLMRLRRGGARVFTVQYHVSGEAWEASAACSDEPSTRLYPSIP